MFFHVSYPERVERLGHEGLLSIDRPRSAFCACERGLVWRHCFCFAAAAVPSLLRPARTLCVLFSILS